MAYRAGAIGVVLCLLLLSAPVAASANFGSSGLGGGGDTNTVAVAPTDSPCKGTDSNMRSTRDMLAGGDVFGMNLSQDGGQSWAPHNQGIADDKDLGVSGLTFEPGDGDGGTADNNDQVYALVGKNTDNNGAVLMATGCGTGPWTTIFQPPDTSRKLLVWANSLRPREVGDLLVALASRTVLIAGAADGLYVLTRANPSAAWFAPGQFCGQQFAMAGLQIRSLNVDPQDPNVVYVSYGPGAQPVPPATKTDAVSYGVAAMRYDPTQQDIDKLGVVGQERLSGQATPTTRNTPHDVVSMSLGNPAGQTQVFVAMGSAGVRACTNTPSVSSGAGAGLSCSNGQYGSLGSQTVGGNTPIGGDWTTLAARVDNSKSPPRPLLLAGCTSDDASNQSCWDPNNTPADQATIFVLDQPFTLNQTADWSAAAPAASAAPPISQLTNSAASTPWWMRFAGDSMINGREFTSAQLLLDNDAPTTTGAFRSVWVLSVGRVGIWRGTLDLTGGAPSTVQGWQPASNGLAASEAWSVSADPNGNVAVGDTDWAGLVSTNNLTVTPQPLHASPGGTSYATATYRHRMFYGTGAKAPVQKPMNPTDIGPIAHVYACDIAGSVELNAGSKDCGATLPNGDLDPIDLGAPGDSQITPDRVIGLAVGKAPNQTGPDDYTVIASTECAAGSNQLACQNNQLGGGIWFRQFGQTHTPWTRITAAGTPGSLKLATQATANHNISLIWSEGAKYLYAFDPALGELFRSPDLSAGAAWTANTPWQFDVKWHPGSITDSDGTGYIAGDLSQYGQGANPTYLWASTSLGVYRLASLGATGNVTVVHLTEPDGTLTGTTGAIAVDRSPSATDDTVVFTRRSDAPSGADRWIVASGTSPPVATPALPSGFLAQSFLPASLAVSYVGSVRHEYIANRTGGGLLVAPAPTK